MQNNGIANSVYKVVCIMLVAICALQSAVYLSARNVEISVMRADLAKSKCTVNSVQLVFNNNNGESAREIIVNMNMHDESYVYDDSMMTLIAVRAQYKCPTSRQLFTREIKNLDVIKRSFAFKSDPANQGYVLIEK